MKYKRVLTFLLLLINVSQSAQNYQIKTTDGKTKTFTHEEVTRLNTLKNLLEDLGEEDNSKEKVITIPLSSKLVTDQGLLDLLNLTNCGQEEQDKQTILGMLNQLSLSRVVSLLAAGCVLDPNHTLLKFEHGNNLINNFIKNSLAPQFYENFISKIKENSLTQEDEKLLEKIDLNMNLRDLILQQPIKKFEDIKDIYFGYFTDTYFVIDSQNQGYFYKGIKSIAPEYQEELKSVARVFFSNKSDFCLVKFTDNSGQFFENAKPQGNKVEDVFEVVFDENSDNCFIKDTYKGVQFFEKSTPKGKKVYRTKCKPMNNKSNRFKEDTSKKVFKIFSSVYSDYAFKQNSSFSGQFIKNNIAQGEVLYGVVAVYFSNYSDCSVVQYNNSAQLFEEFEPVGESLDDVESIKVSSYSDNCFIKNKQNKGILYNFKLKNSLNKQGQSLLNILKESL